VAFKTIAVAGLVRAGGQRPSSLDPNGPAV
jgi:hypothetical protein